MNEFKTILKKTFFVVVSLNIIAAGGGVLYGLYMAVTSWQLQ